VGVVAQAAGGVGDADQFQQLDGPRLGLLRRHVVVAAQRLGHLPPHAEHRVEGGHRVLEDHGHFAAAHGLHLLFRQLQQVAAHQQRLAAGDLPRRARDEAQHGHHADRLAAAALADDGHHLALVDAIGDVVDGMDDALRRVEAHLQIADVEQDVALVRSAPVVRRAGELGRGPRRSPDGRGSHVGQIARVGRVHQTLRLRGSRASRRPSPTKLMLNTVSRMSRPGNIHSQGADSM